MTARVPSSARLRRLGARVAARFGRSPDLLTRLADRYGTDKGTALAGHQYTRIYSELFEPWRDRPIRLLEIGLMGLGRGGWVDEQLRDKGRAVGRNAPSLRMWAHYFPRGEIFGLDFNDFSQVQIERCRIFQADASCPEQLRSVLDEIGGSFDIVIDDASHASDHQQITLGTVFPAVAPGGVFIIEDLFYQPPDREPAGATKTVDLLRRAEVTGEFRGSHLTAEASTHLEAHVARVALFDSLAPGRAFRNRDGIAVLWKRGSEGGQT